MHFYAFGMKESVKEASSQWEKKKNELVDFPELESFVETVFKERKKSRVIPNEQGYKSTIRNGLEAEYREIMKLLKREPKEKLPKVEPKGVADRLVLVLATGFGSGYAPVAPGTVGALWGLGLFILLAWLEVSIPVYLLVAILLIMIAVPVCGRAERLLGERDSGKIVLDEIVSVPVTFVPVYPFVVALPAVYLIITGFCLNRLFDIVKLYPAGRSQRLPGGWGVVIDDVIAGVQSNIIMQALALVLLALAR